MLCALCILFKSRDSISKTYDFQREISYLYPRFIELARKTLNKNKTQQQQEQKQHISKNSKLTTDTRWGLYFCQFSFPFLQFAVRNYSVFLLVCIFLYLTFGQSRFFRRTTRCKISTTPVLHNILFIIGVVSAQTIKHPIIVPL